jgi:tripartite-type tricarboxylate transporter receptor subunit TctC
MRFALLGSALVASLMCATVPAHSQSNYPDKTVRIISPFSAGGTSDYMARLIADEMSKSLGQSVVVENIAGAGGLIGSAAVAQAPADGYTFLLGSITTHAIAPLLQPENVPFDAQHDFSPVTIVATAPSLLVVADSSPIKSLKDLLELAKTKNLTYGSAGPGTIAHLTTELFAKDAGAKVVHVPYKGDAPALTDLLGGRLDLMFGAISSPMSMVRSGSLRPLAVSSKTHSTAMPDIPTVAEAGGPADFEMVSWWVFSGPAGIPDDILKKVNASVVEALHSERVRDSFAKQGIEAQGTSIEETQAFLTTEWDRWSKALPELGISLE